MKQPLVSVIVTTKNNEPIIRRCLQSVIQQSYRHIELIVVDNFSNDRTQEISRTFTSLIFSRGPEISAQRNFAAGKAKGDYFFFIDSDMEFLKNVVKDCVEKINHHAGLVVPEHFIGKGFWTACKILEKSSYTGTDDGIAARFFPRTIFFQLKGYDEALTGPEDIDMHKRVVKLGSVGRSSEFITHDDGRLTLSQIVRKRYYYSLTLQLYLKKHREVAKREFRFFRPAYLQNWKLFARDPAHAAGMLIMRFLEGLAVLLALWRQR